MAPKSMLTRMRSWIDSAAHAPEPQEPEAEPAGKRPQKRPAAEGAVVPSLKRPAAAPKPEKPAVAQDGADNDDDAGDRGRGRLKSRAFKLALEAGDLPDAVADAFNNAKRRQTKTEIINKAVTRDSAGKWALNFDDPMFEEIRTRYSRKEGKDSKRAVPRALAVSQCGGEEGFQKALAAGDVEEVTEGDKKFYAWRELKVSTTHGYTEETTLKGKKSIGHEEALAVLDILRCVKWELQVSPAQERKMIEQKHVPEKVLKTIQEAHDATNGLVKEGTRLLPALLGQGDSGKTYHKELLPLQTLGRPFLQSGFRMALRVSFAHQYRALLQSSFPTALVASSADPYTNHCCNPASA